MDDTLHLPGVTHRHTRLLNEKKKIKQMASKVSVQEELEDMEEILGENSREETLLKKADKDSGHENNPSTFSRVWTKEGLGAVIGAFAGSLSFLR